MKNLLYYISLKKEFFINIFFKKNILKKPS